MSANNSRIADGWNDDWVVVGWCITKITAAPKARKARRANGDLGSAKVTQAGGKVQDMRGADKQQL
jgi:hypothetical protein